MKQIVIEFYSFLTVSVAEYIILMLIMKVMIDWEMKPVLNIL